MLAFSCILGGGDLMGQTVTIGSGTSTNQNVPIASSQTHSLSEQIYTEAEISAAEGYSGNIVSIDFFNSAWSNKTRNFNIYLVHTDKSSFTSTTDWISGVTPSDLVYSGSVTLAYRNWTTITFSSKFNWNGTSNIALIIDSNSGDSGLGSYVFSGSSQSLYINGATDFDPTNISATGTCQDVKNIIKLTFEPLSSCSKPTELACLCFTSNTATFDWTENGTADTWQIVYSTDPDFAPNSATPITVITKPYTLRGLTTGTTYYAYVRSYCDADNQSAWSNKCEFTPSTNIALTANDGSSANSSVPVYYSTISGSSDPKSQYIIPSSNLNAMKGGEIQKITFYNNYASLDYGDAEFDVYLGEVNYTTIEGLCDWSNLSKVYSGSITVNSDKEMELSLSSSYTYHGGNLLIGFYRTKKGTNPSFNSWYGITTNYNSSILVTTINSFAQFIPKTTFTYTPAIKFATAGNWNVTDNWYGNIPSSTDNILITAAITIPNGYTATANNITIAGGSLTIADGGQLILPKTSTGIQATVKKETYAATAKDAKSYYWYAISSAVSDPNIASATNIASSGTYDLYRYNEEKNAELPWENYKNTAYSSTFTTLEKGRGYLYRNASDLSIAMTGEINVEDFNYAVTKTGSGVLAGFNLIGNPYSHDIYKGAGTAIPNGSGLLRTGFYYMEPTTGKWTAGTDNSTAIKPNQGVLVQTDANGSIEMTNTNSNGSSKSNNDNIMFKVANSQYSDEAYAWFDKGRGLNKISHRNAEVPMLYINQDGENYAIATMSDDIKTFSLNFKAMTMGKYTLSYKTKGEFNYLHVIDRFTGEDVDMLLEGEYSFVASPNDSDARFIVRLEYTSNNGTNDSSVFAYQSGNEIIVSGEGELQIFDVMGRKISTHQINNVETVNVNAHGVYIFKLNEKTQKIIIK